MLIQQKEINKQGIFYVNDGEEHPVAELIYTIIPHDRMVIEHTEVNRSLQGKHVGSDLVKAAVEHAREHHLKIIPSCPFARDLFQREPDYSDVLAQDT